MLKHPPAPLTFYPAYCFPVSPTFNTWAKVTAADVHALQEREGFEGQKIFFHLNHPIKWIRLVGVVVALDEHPNRWILIIDDSSGETLEIMCPKAVTTGYATNTAPTATIGNEGLDMLSDRPRTDAINSTMGTTVTGQSIDLTGVDVGSIVKVKGGVGGFRGVRQMTLERINILHTTNDEATAWAELSHFRSTILNHQWVVSPEKQKSLREEVDGTRRREEERQGRRRERERKRKANGERESRRKTEGRTQAKTAKDRACQISRDEGRSREKRRVSDKENHVDEAKLEGEGVWAREEKERRREAARRSRHRREKRGRGDPPEPVEGTVVKRA